MEQKSEKLFDTQVIDWLLEEDNPPVRYLTLTTLLNKPDDDPAVIHTKAALMSYSVTQEILRNFDQFSEQDDKAYWKYTGFYWQLIFLGQFIADGQDERIKSMVTKLLNNRKWISHLGGQCLTANLLTASMQLGYAEDRVVISETETLAARYLEDDGIRCHAMDYSLLPRCFMALPKLLLCFARFSVHHSSGTVRLASQHIVDELATRHIYKYVPEKRKEWTKILEAAPKRAELPSGTTVKQWIQEERSQFIEKNGIGERQAKQGWLKFGFPLHYNSDLLEAMYALALAGVKMHSNFRDPLQLILSKKDAGGKWPLENSLNGKMWADVEETGQPSKWITYFALFVLSCFSGRNAT